MNYEYYRVFFSVGRHKNFTRAAKELFSSQPAVTRVIKNMETELGCQLFVRSKNGVSFTRAGQALYDLIEAPCNLLMHADQAFHQSAGWSSETIYIGTTDTALQCFLFHFLEAYRTKYSHINFKIHTGSSSRMISKLKQGEIDLVFNTTPFSNAQALRITPVYELADILVGGTLYQELQGRPHSLKELQNYPFILLSRNMQFRQFCDSFFSRHGVHIEPALEADSSGLLVPLAAHNWGLAFVPEEMAAEGLQKGDILQIELSDTIPRRAVTLVTDPQRPLSGAARLMCELASNMKLR